MARLSPVALFAYNRPELLKQALDALASNFLAENTDIYIFSDAPKSEEDLTRVTAVRGEASQPRNFRSIKIIEREENYGLANNIIGGVTDIIQEHGRIIVLEDDLRTSTNFLCFMNSCLEYYQGRTSIYSISGYTPSMPILSALAKDSYLSFRPSSWGWATWSDRWERVDWSVADYSQFMSSPSRRREFNRGGIDLRRMLTHYMQGKNNSWAIRWAYDMYKRDMHSVYPVASKVQNIGFGANGTHCQNRNIYGSDLDLSRECSFHLTDEGNPEPVVSKQFRYVYSYRNKLIKKLGLA